MLQLGDGGISDLMIFYTGDVDVQALEFQFNILFSVIGDHIQLIEHKACKSINLLQTNFNIQSIFNIKLVHIADDRPGVFVHLLNVRDGGFFLGGIFS